ncbi:FHF complex subunit HOOK interacting protein 1B isoform X3 [Erpetoichthys calabaricus]|uniref:FHF complex subunit HOOK interacting protein 1B isoform X3 n=1 Tax=Erpetoichthys calabaricus TaxID=27687 RepID=UPI002234B668|nr:FHF complex subunit HOOK interacting protein 1B isoform X3 [Erpetoichthys calabaricus]
MSWLSRLTPRTTGNRASQAATLSSPLTADPETCLMVFKNHWRQVSWILEKQEPSLSTGDELSAIRNHTDQMLCLLAEEHPIDHSSMGPILELVVKENILVQLVQWHLNQGLDPDSHTALLKLFEMLIGQSHQSLLCHKAVLQPLLSLLKVCAEINCNIPAIEGSLVLLLNQVCVSMVKDPPILELFFYTPTEQGPTNMLIFSLLVPFIHRDGVIGQQARDALLLVMATSASNPAVAKYIAENSYFCPVLATGLSALYSSLPRKIEVRGDDWHALRREDWIGVSSLVLFMNSLEFCNAVIQVSHPLVKNQLVDYVHNGFLVPVLGPALHKTSAEEMITSTAYLDLFLRSITETALLKAFLRFILLHRHDNETILDTLITRINSGARLCMVSLSLFKTLLSLNCEDFMLQLVLRYLLPCTHVMISQRRAVREIDIYGKSSDKFLSLIPECCKLELGSTSEHEEDSMYWSRVPTSPAMESPAKPSTPSRLAFFIRQQSMGSSSNLDPPQSPRSSSLTGESPESPLHQTPDLGELETGYLEYLKDARKNIEQCAWACRCWSAPYDGEAPSPNCVTLPPPNPSSLNITPEHYGNPILTVEKNADFEGIDPSLQSITNSHKSDKDSSDRDSGEWDITIGHNCISLTPRTKKRTLRPQGILPTASSQSSGPCSASHSQLPVNGSGYPFFNGIGQMVTGTKERQDEEMEVKKVRRDDNIENDCGVQNGVKDDRQQSPEARRQLSSKSQVLSPLSSSLSQKSLVSQIGDVPHLDISICTAEAHSLESVESLIDELIDQAPGEINGSGISIEVFSKELRELEETVQQHQRQRIQTLCDDAKDTSNGGKCPSLYLYREEEESCQSLDLNLADSTIQKVQNVGTMLTSPARSAGQPYTGPFIAALFAKLENMMQNSLYVNIMLTGMLSQLACYPQPLLRSFLLNTNMVFQPSVKSLIQVLGSVKNKIEVFASTQEDFPGMLRKARKYLVARGKVDWAESPTVLPNLRRSETLVKSRKTSLGELILRHTNSPTRAKQAAQLAFAHVRDGGQVLHSALFRGSAVGTVERQNEALRVKNAVYCAIIFTEFLKELAALAQEHAVTTPFPLYQETEE